ncbi:MAG TPA: DUF1707 domain-containing protein [Streptosporangiaceae bacterium]|nr:DUF1707 domain-containing protein [Streptosporangiaceae bacterium]
MRTDHGDEIAAAAGAHGQLRASHADREHVVDVLKAAFVQGRLTRDELDVRAGQAFTAKTYAQLGALTADIPARPAEAAPAPAQTRPPLGKVVKSGAGAMVAAGVAAVAVLGAAVVAHARPGPDMLACQTFSAWSTPGNTGSSNIMLLNFSVAAASQGSDRILAGDLEALQQAVQRYENPAGPLPSPSALQVDHNRVASAIARVSADCVSHHG